MQHKFLYVNLGEWKLEDMKINFMTPIQISSM